MTNRAPLLITVSFLALATTAFAQTPAPAVDAASPSAADVAAQLTNPVELPTEAPISAPVVAQPAPAADVVPPNPIAMPTEPPPALVAPVQTAQPAAPVVPAAPAVAVPDPAVVAREAVVAELTTTLEKLDVSNKVSAEVKQQRLAIQAFYKNRMYQPLFMDGLGLAEAGKAAGARMALAAEDGLSPADYKLPVVAQGAAAADLAKAEIAFAEAALAYAHDAQVGRFSPTRVSALVTPKIDAPVADEVLVALATSKNVSATLEGYNPPHEGYRALKAKLAEIKVAKPQVEPEQVKVPAGATIKPGVKDARVALLRQRMGMPIVAGVDPEIYDDQLLAAVKDFQRENDMEADGLAGASTIAALNRPAGARNITAADIIVNMERWRWLPRDLGQKNVMVNIPGFYLDIWKDGKSIHHTRVIVGKTSNGTPVFSDLMTHIIVNPYWNVPVSILKKEMMDSIQASGGASLDKGNYEVVIKDRVVASNSVDWANVNPSSVTVRQRPGAGNALGNVKFMFPNQHSVYLHDTSSRNLFSQDFRSLSHGCVRVFEPFAFANALLSEEPTGLTGDKLKAMVGGAEKYNWLKTKIPVHLTYFTAFNDLEGKFQARPDLYGYDAKMKQILGL